MVTLAPATTRSGAELPPSGPIQSAPEIFLFGGLGDDIIDAIVGESVMVDGGAGNDAIRVEVPPPGPARRRAAGGRGVRR